jgi:restriction system protein
LAPGAAVLFLITGGISALEGWRKGRMLDSQESIKTVGALSWKEFEELVSEVFRRKGYFVLENPDLGADGGVDLRLRKDGKKIYVQCKHWKARQVGVKVVRELYGVMMDKHADEGVVVTYGTFTQEARDFVRGKPISLVDGNKLIGLIGEVQKNPGVSIRENSQKMCPKCGSEMILRTAKKGTHAGEKFWGCSKFPECRAILIAGDN